MTIRANVRIISFTLALILILGVSSAVNMRYTKAYKAQLELSYQQSLNELSESLDMIETNLEKSLYSSSSNMLLDISADLYSECTEASEALSRLPVNQMNLSGTFKFINQASDYANYIASKCASGEEISDEEHKTLSTLLNYAKTLNQGVENMVDICNRGGKITQNKVKSTANVSTNIVATGINTAENAFKSYPTLLYDGPFSDSVMNRDSELIKNSEKISKDEAKRIAANALDCNEDLLKAEANENGDIPCYVFSSTQKTVGVTMNGGYVAYILYSGKISRSVITEENAINIARDYLDKIGYENMSESYYMVDDGICVINFAHKNNGVIYYTDLIKVGVSMQDGRVLSMNAQGYITNHIDTKPADNKISVDEAKESVSPYLTILDSKCCVIPLNNGKQAQCWEFHCRSTETGDEVLIYINTQNKKEENILLLLYSDGGTLTK